MIAPMTRKEKSPLARRLTKYRKAAGFASPDQLAQSIGNPSVTKSVIVNLEQDRKTDMTVTQLLLLSKALDIPALALISDCDEPFGRPDIPGFEENYNVDLADLLVPFSGAFAPLQDDKETRLLKARSEGAKELIKTYKYLTYLSCSLFDYSVYLKRAKEKELSGASDTEVVSLLSDAWGAKRTLKNEVEYLSKYRGIELPSEIRDYVNQVTTTPLLYKDVDMDDYFAERAKESRQIHKEYFEFWGGKR
jgi:transcriptional regulator with XRE-family HTH domain